MLVALAAGTVLGGCASNPATRSSVSPTRSASGSQAAVPLRPTYANKEFAFSITYDKARLPIRERAFAANVMGPARPANWTGVYLRNFLMTISNADSSDVLNLGFYDRNHVADGLFISASRREQRRSVSTDLGMAGGVQAFLHGVLQQDVKQGKAFPAPPAVTIGGLPGYRVTIAQGKVEYQFYVLYSQRNEYLLCLTCADDRLASELPMLQSVVRSLRVIR